MRKLSELYQIILDRFNNLSSCGICGRINELAIYGRISLPEKELLLNHFQRGKHEKPMRNRVGYWFNSTPTRIAYLKYLIELCKEQDI